VDQATKDTLVNFQSGKDLAEWGSGSGDLAGASRMAPVVWAHAHEPEALLAAARAQTKMTHDNALVLLAAGFFAQTVLLVVEGQAPVPALERAAGEHLAGSPLAGLFQAGLASRKEDTTRALLGFGTACPILQSFPGAIHILAKYPDDLEGGLVANVMSGGDSSGRGMMAAMVLAAHLGPDALPGRWVEDLEARARMYELLHLG
jgi:ADP-ribosylglycohydrolase